MSDDVPSNNVPLPISIDIEQELQRPRVVALVFCDWHNQTIEEKQNLIGTFERIYTKSLPANSPPFFLVVRMVQVLRGTLLISVLDPNGVIGFQASLDIGEHAADENATEPLYLQVVTRLQFKISRHGIYWVDVSLNDQSLGGAPLAVVPIETTEQSTDVEVTSEPTN
jgi:hypothetical protein